MERNVAIVHYNTPELTDALVRSLRKWSPAVRITIFDNSDRRPFEKVDGVDIIDNTKGAAVDFAAMLDGYPKKIPTACNWGSEKHIASVDYLFDVLRDGFVLLDSDTLLKRDIEELFNPAFAWIGKVEYKPRFWFQAVRCYPYLLWINVPMLRRYGIRFFHDGMVYKMSHAGIPYYDTGGSLYSDCYRAGLPTKEIEINQYIEHLGGASCGDTDWRLWLEKHRDLYE